MSVFSVDIDIGDPAGREFVTVNAVVDTAASYTTLPESLLHRLGIRPRARRRFVLADSRVVHYPLGQTTVRLEGAEFTVPVVFAPDSDPDSDRALIGATTLEIFGLGVDLRGERLIPEDGFLL